MLCFLAVCCRRNVVLCSILRSKCSRCTLYATCSALHLSRFRPTQMLGLCLYQRSLLFRAVELFIPTFIGRNLGMASNRPELKYLTQKEAADLDNELFTEYAFSVDQLMELAGLAVASVITKEYPCPVASRPIICCGPGNNGGDGLVCARHLKVFGYSPTVIAPKPGRGQLYQNLLTQCGKFGIPVLHETPNQPLDNIGNLIVDAVFGFSFKPPNRNADLAKLLNSMDEYSSRVPLVSVDIPSGWHVENGNKSINEDQTDVEQSMRIPNLKPNCLISLTAPKLCARSFKGRHYLAGRFCPQAIEDKYQLNLPPYPGSEGIVLLT